MVVRNIQVLVVDDDPDHLHIARRRLQKRGFDVVEARDGVEALEAMIAHPHCRRMVTDYDMPRLGGTVWVQTLERFCPDWRVVVVSGGDHEPGRFPSHAKPADFEDIAAYLADGDE